MMHSPLSCVAVESVPSPGGGDLKLQTSVMFFLGEERQTFLEELGVENS